MRFTTMKICRNHAVLAVMALLAGAAACTGRANLAALSSENQPAAQFALTTSDLPTCGSSRDGEIYYVSSDSKFYVCNGSTRTWVQTNLNGVNGASRVTPISPGSQCRTGGYSIQFGLDLNRNGTLDTSDVHDRGVQRGDRRDRGAGGDRCDRGDWPERKVVTDRDRARACRCQLRQRRRGCADWPRH
jgi:hypothetical protein